jgi:alpha-beta hydrolase superfamily lysophospholipase
MRVTEFNIPHREGQSFFACEWSPAGEPKGVILLIHGLSDHAGRYHHVGSFFATAGYAMIVVDLRGNGRSFGKRGHFPSYEIIMDDISLFIETARKRQPGLPLFLYGHSMGGNLVLNYLIRYGAPAAGAIVTSPWLRLNLQPPFFKLILAILANRVFPSLTQPDGIIPAFLSHDEEVGRRYAADPLVHKQISVRTFLEISRAGEYAIKDAARVSCPLLLMHGTDDQLTSFEASREFSEKMVVQHTFKAWDGLYHELHNEFEKETVLGLINDWIGRRIASNAKSEMVK